MLSSVDGVVKLWRTFSWRDEWVIVLDVVIYVWRCWAFWINRPEQSQTSYCPRCCHLCMVFNFEGHRPEHRQISCCPWCCHRIYRAIRFWTTLSWTAKWVTVLDVVIYLWHCPALRDTILYRVKWVLSWNSCISGFEGHLSEQPSEHCVGQLTTRSLFPPGWNPLLFSGHFKVFAFVGDTVVFCTCCLFVVSLFSAAIVIVVFCRSSPLFWCRGNSTAVFLLAFTVHRWLKDSARGLLIQCRELERNSGMGVVRVSRRRLQAQHK